MFQDSSIFVLGAGSHANEVFRIDVDSDTQAEICKSFSDAKKKLIEEKERIVFDGSYKPNDDEFLVIENFQIIDEIKDAIRDPIGETPYQSLQGDYPEIKAIFLGKRTEADNSEQFSIAFQRFRKEQYISTKWFNLFFNNSTFQRQRNFGISISDTIDCFYKNGELQFVSFFYARQIFDLGEYYRSATDKEVLSFASNPNLEFEDSEAFSKMADTWIRRKIAMINDSKVLENFPVADIVRRASKVGVKITANGGKIVLPNDKKLVKVILGFLDEEAYKGPFSKNTYLANSKRQVNAR